MPHLCGRCRLRCVIPSITAAVIPGLGSRGPAEKLNLMDKYGNFTAVNPILLPSLLHQFSINGNLLPLSKIGTQRFGRLPDNITLEKTDFIRIAGLRFSAAIDRNRKMSETNTGVRITQLDVLRQSAD